MKRKFTIQILTKPNKQARALTCDELRDEVISKIIARKLANVHCLNVPINKEPTWLFNQMYEWLEKVRTLNVNQLKENDRLLNKKSSKKQQKQQLSKNPFNYEAAKFILEFDYEREIKWLKDFLKQCESPVVFAHNDAQEGNILIPDYLSSKEWSNSNAEFDVESENNNRLNVKNKNKPKHLATKHLNLRKSDLMSFKFGHRRRSSSPDDLYDSGLVNDNSTSDDDGLVNDFGSEEECNSNHEHEDENETSHLTTQHFQKQLEEKMVLIDFEFCSYNYRGFDLANHFCEWMYDYSYDKFPHYKFNPTNYPDENQINRFINEYINHYYQGNTEEEKATVDKILNEISYFTLASHMLWTLWSINNAVNAQISFGYWVSFLKITLYIQIHTSTNRLFYIRL